MKGIYWRPKHVSRNVLLLVALLSIGGIVLVELLQTQVKQPNFSEKLKAAKHMAASLEELKRMREKLRIPIDPESDPSQSGVVGWPLSSITSNSGDLGAKQTTINPNFAAVVAHLLKKAGVEKGDVVAVGLTGSFPCLNLAVLSACQALEVTPISITSAAASEYGANIPGFSWLEMEKHLVERDLIPKEYLTVAASLGGTEDKGRGMNPEGRRFLRGLIERLGIPLLWPKTPDEGIEERMATYVEKAQERPIKAYVNVGGGTLSVGTAVGKKMFKPGLNLTVPSGAMDFPSVMLAFAQQGVPVIHLTKVKDLAARYDLPAEPRELPRVGYGNIFYKVEYNLWLVGGVLFVIIAALWLLVRMNLAQTFVSKRAGKGDGMPEPMV
jgi:poly-gamma-glutamate system protein